MYTLNNPLNDRFGYKTNGVIKCAYKKEKTAIIIGAVPLIALAVQLVITLIMFFDLFNKNGAIKDGLIEIVFDGSTDHVVMTGGTTAYSMSFFTVLIFGIIFIVLLLLYILLIAFIKSGKAYRFEADENRMTIMPPKGAADIIFVKDLVSVNYSERRSLLGTKGYDITVKTTKRKYVYHLIHDHFTKTEGIYGTPFNILIEITRKKSTAKQQNDII